MSSNGDAAGALRAFRDRIARLEEEKKAIQADIKDVYAEVKACGFDTKAMRVVVKRFLEDESQKTARRETEELAEIYLANLGMLDGTPLGDSARERMAQPPQEERSPASSGKASAESDKAEEVPPRGAFTEQDIEDARQQGEQDAGSGKRIIDNPFVAGDPRRAAWDEGHCSASGSDGMDIPDAWRRKPKSDAPNKGAEE